MRTVSFAMALLLAMLVAGGCSGKRPHATDFSGLYTFPTAQPSSLSPSGEGVFLQVLNLTSPASWTVHSCSAAGEMTEIDRGDGMPFGVSASPDGQQLLVSWTERSPRLKPEDRRVRWLTVHGEETHTVAEFRDELGYWMVGLPAADAWEAGGTRWLSRRMQGGVVAVHEGKQQADLRIGGGPQAKLRAVWPAAGKQPGAYGLRSDGSIYLTTAGSSSVVAKVPLLSADGAVAAVSGTTLYAVAPSGLARVDLGTGKVVVKPLPKPINDPRRVSVLRTTDEAGRLVLAYVTTRSDGDRPGASIAYELDWTRMSAGRIAAVPAAQPVLAAEGGKLWAAWPEAGMKAVLGVAPLPEP